MKMKWMLLAILPVVTSLYGEGDFFYVAEESEDALFQMGLEAQEDLLSADDYNTEGLSLMEMDERDESLVPWALDTLASEEISSYIEERALRLSEEFDDVYAYGLPEDRNAYEPTLEKVPEMEKKLFSRPRVVPLKENPVQIVQSEPELDVAAQESIETPAPVKKEFVEKAPAPTRTHKSERRLAPKASMAKKEMIIQMPVKQKRRRGN